VNRTQKAEAVVEIRDRFDRMLNAIVTDYRGLNVDAMTRLRRKFNEAKIDYKVVKNTLVKRAVADLPFAEDLAPHLCDMVAIAWSYEDPSASAKVIKEFTKDNDKLKIKCGIMDGKVSTAKGWEDMPSREELLAMISGQLMSAPQGIVSQLMRPAQDIVGLIDAWKEKLENE